MQVRIKRADAPSISKEIKVELESLSPPVYMQWNPMVRKSGDLYDYWEGRWEIWCELQHSTHRDAKNERLKTDRWNTDKQCWMRKLQLYQTEGGDYAPVDRGLLIGLHLADTWGNRLFYEEHVEIPYELEELEKQKWAAEASKGASHYYKNFDNPTVGAYSKSRDWRWRQR